MPELRYEQIPVRAVIKDFREGRLVVPEFQREYIWPANRAAKLLDSLYCHFPISSLLVWETEDKVEHRRDQPKPQRSGPVGWLIDGQQRVITLSRVADGDDDVAVVFNEISGGFSRPNAATRNDPQWLNVADVWDDDWYRTHRKNLPDNAIGRETETRLEKVRSILDYYIPIVRMIGYGLAGAVDAFTRINSLGVRLGDADLKSAEIALRHAGFVRRQVAPFLAQLRANGFDRIAATQLFRAGGFIANPDGRKRTPLHDLNEREVNEAWKKTKDAVENARGILSGQLGIVDMAVLWSANLLVPMIAYCGSTQVRDRKPSEIAGWLAAAALRHRYSKSSGSRLEQDLKACRASDPIAALLGNLRSGNHRLRATTSDFAGSIADKSALLALYVACKQLGLRDLVSGGSLLLHAGLDRHHIFPRSRFTPHDRADTLANIAFISKESNKALSDTPPDVYLASCDEKTLRSQAIPLEKRLWRLECAEEFWARRRALLADAFDVFLKAALSQRRRIGDKTQYVAAGA